MTKWFDNLNLSPTERRLVLVGLVIVSVVLHFWLVQPFFGEWSQMTRESENLQRQKNKFIQEIAKKPTYERRIQELQREGALVPAKEAANQLQSTIYTEASRAGISISRLIPQIVSARTGASGQTNQFFEEHVVKVDIAAGEEQLVNFLYRLGTGDSMIRVRDVANLRLDPSQTRLMASLDLVASFPRRTASTASASATGSAGAGQVPSRGQRTVATSTPVSNSGEAKP